MQIKEISSKFDRMKAPFGNESNEITPLDWVDLVLAKAVDMGASDVHFDVIFARAITRFRVDGILEIIDERPRDNFEMVIARFKIMSFLNSAEHRLPQEGHATVILPMKDNMSVDIRISVFPTIFGEAVAVRILNRREFLFNSFEEMGMDQRDADVFKDALLKPHGMVLVTGPTGSGKSATIYTALNLLRSKEKNIVTLEDPVEYQLDMTRQSQINTDISYNFARGMRSILRQDPDVIMIGEIRDDETAEIAVRAALTGRLLFSTMHTNNTLGAVIRFVEFGIPRSFIASALSLVVAKRLIRKNCPDCMQNYMPSEKIIKESGITPDSTMTFRRGVGCDNCRGSGYAGRVGIYEMFSMDKDMEMMIVEEVPFATLWEAARARGTRTLREEAIRMALTGETTLEEALHVTA